MAQQMINGSYYDSDRTITNRMSKDYAVVNPPFEGKHRKPQDLHSILMRKARWGMRHEGIPLPVINRMLKSSI